MGPCERRSGSRWRGGLLALLFLVVSGCNGAAAPSGPVEIPGPVSVDGVFPPDDSTDFSRTASLQIPFTEPMNTASVEAAFSLSPETEAAALVKWQSVTGTFSWNDDDTEMTFSPATALEPLTRYCMRIAEGALTAAGEESPAFESCFTTGGEVVNLDGTWVSSCYSKGGPTEDRIDTVVVTGGGASITWTEEHYEAGTDCTVVQYNAISSASLISQGPSDDVAGAEKVIGTNISETATPLSASIVTDWNNATPSGFCGYTDWAVGVAKDIAGNGTASSLGNCWGESDVVGSTFNSLMYIDEGAEPDTLQVGDDNTCTGSYCTGSEFPTSLETVVLVKQ